MKNLIVTKHTVATFIQSLFVIVFFLFSYSSVSAKELVQLYPYERQVSLTGFTRPVNTMIIAAEVNGRCTEVLVDVGDTVGPDTVVAILDSTFVRMDLEKNRIAQQRAKHQLELHRKTLARYTSLVNTQAAAQATFEEAELKAEIDKLALLSLKNEEIRLLELLKRHTLHGPVGWQVIKRFIEPGEFAPLGKPILQLGNFRALTIPFLLTYEELRLLQKNQTITLFFPDLNENITAKIHRVAPDFDEERRKISIDLIIENENVQLDRAFRGGLRAQLRINGKNETNTFLIPYAALINRYEAHWLIRDDGQRKQVIFLGRSEDGKNAIITGNNLSNGDLFQFSDEANR